MESALFKPETDKFASICWQLDAKNALPFPFHWGSRNWKRQETSFRVSTLRLMTATLILPLVRVSVALGKAGTRADFEGIILLPRLESNELLLLTFYA